MSEFSSPQREHEFRARTAAGGAFAGVTLPSLICACCHRQRRAAGRQRVVKAYFCAECFDRLQARRSAPRIAT